MVDLDETQLAKLAREMVMNIRNYKDVFADYGIDERDYHRIEKIEFFKRVKEQFQVDWNASTSTKERLRIGGLAYLEQLTPIITRRAMQADTHLNAAIDAGKLLMKMAGVGETETEKTNAERFVISINMGGEVETYDKPIAVEINETALKIGKNGADNG